MRISLYSGNTLYPLAGQSGVSERTHSSAADFELTPESEVQIAAFVRGEYAKPIDRGNLLNVLRFTTSRLFATPAEAWLWALDYDRDFPSSGQLHFDAVAPGGVVTRRTLANAVVAPPRRRVAGCTVLLDYTVQGSGITGYTGRIIVAGAVGGYGNGTYEIGSLSSGKLSYYLGSHAIFWIPSGAGYWQFSPAGGGAVAMKSSSNVDTPDQATAWVKNSDGSSVAGFSVTAEPD